MTPDDLIGKWYNFYGAVNNFFRLNGLVYECEEDECDGWRSMMGEFTVRSPENTDGLYNKPFARVKIEKSYNDGLWEIKDNIGHTWLTFGTDKADAWYPIFIFNYQPKPYEQARHDLLTVDLAGIDDND